MTPMSRRNRDALERFLHELADISHRHHSAKCPCGYDMLEIPIHEVVEIYVCPSCRRVIECTPDEATVIYKGYRSPK